MSTRILSENWYDSQIYAASDVSSEQASFVASNTESKKRRARVWRSNGYFNVTSSNNTLIFEETASTNLTATIAVAEYSSLTTFLAAVKTALDAAGGSVYTVSQNTTTLKVTIASDGAGGGGILNLEWDHASTTCEALLGFDNSATDTGALTYTADTISLAEEEFITIDLGLPSTPTGFAMIGRRNSGIGLSSTGTFKLQGSSTDAWTSPLYDQTLTFDDEVIGVFDDEDLTRGLHTSPLRYWRISMVDITNPEGFLELSNIFLGTSIGEAFTGAVTYPLSSSLLDQSTTVTSQSGSTFSDLKSRGQSFSMKWDHLRKEDLEIFEDFYNEYGTGSPFFISLDPCTAFSTAFNRRLVYVKMTGPPSWTLTNPNIFDLTMSVKEEI